MNTNDLYAVANSLTQSVSNFFIQTYHQAGNLAGRAIHLVRSLPQHMQANQNVAIGSFVAVNTFAITLLHLAANWCDKKINDPGYGRELTKMERVFQHLLIDGVGFGGLLLGANVGFSKLTNYPLSKMVLAAITVTITALRLLVVLIFRKPVDSKKRVEQQPPAKANQVTPQDAVTPEVKPKAIVTSQTAPKEEIKAEEEKAKLEAEPKGEEKNAEAETPATPQAAVDDKTPVASPDPKILPPSMEEVLENGKKKIDEGEAPLSLNDQLKADAALNDAVPFEISDAAERQKLIDTQNAYREANKRAKIASTALKSRVALNQDSSGAFEEYVQAGIAARKLAKELIAIFPFVKENTSTAELGEEVTSPSIDLASVIAPE